MARPKLDIAAAVHGAARRRETPTAPDPNPARTTKRAPSRSGKTGIVIYASPELARALRHLAVDEGSSLQALGLEALTALLEARGRPTP